MELSLMAMWGQMSWFVRGIVLVMVGMSVTTVAVALRKWWTIRSLQQASERFAPKFAEALGDDDFQRAKEVAESHPDSHVAVVMREALQEIEPMVERGRYGESVVASADRAVEREQIVLAADLKDGLGVLATIGATAPFVGLLGTVIGIVNSFVGIAESGGGGLEAVSAGIAEALIATAIGLLAAIPAVWLYNYFTGRLENLFSKLAYDGRQLVDWLKRRAELDDPTGRPEMATG